MCTTCGNPCKGHSGPTGHKCQLSKAQTTQESSINSNKNDTSADLNMLKFVAEQMQQLNLNFEALKQSQDNLCQCLMNKQNVTESTIASTTEHSSGGATAEPVLPVQRPMTPAKVTPEQSSIATSLHIPEKTVTSVQDGEYANLTEFIPGNEMAPQDWEAAMVNGQLEMRPKKSRKAIDNFGAWLRAWNRYEMVLLEKHPECYQELIQYRSFIQDCDRKFNWSAVYAYDIRHRSTCACKKSLCFSKVDVNLYTTVMDATSIKKGAAQCYRCKSFDHLVQECPFQASAPMEANPKEGSKVQRNRQTPDRWYHNNQEGCNNFQFGKCTFGQSCKRAHVWKQCKGPDPYYKCKQCN